MKGDLIVRSVDKEEKVRSNIGSLAMCKFISAHSLKSFFID